MRILSEKLSELYVPAWKELEQQMKFHGKKARCPFVLSIARHPNDPDIWKESYEEWYTKADIKIMFFGQEPHYWESGEDLGDTQRTYEMFFEQNCILSETGGWWNESTIHHGNHFMRWGCNGIMSGIMDQILPYHKGKRVAMLWNNISKLSGINGGPIEDSEIHDLERKYFHVIPKEIEILKPDILVFFTGPGHNKYYNYIKENFEFIGESTAIGGLPIHELEKLPLEGVKLAYKTYHPNARGKGKNEEFFWTFYQAILDDIAANFDKIQGLQ